MPETEVISTRKLISNIQDRPSMQRVQGVSLPRSGHNLLVTHLQNYFDSNNVCPDYRSRLIPSLAKAKTKKISASAAPTRRFHYCEYYYSCRQVPCCDANNSYQKSHDFELDLPVDDSQKYIVQARNSLGLLISWFEMRLLKNREEDSPDGFVRFQQRHQPYIVGFRKKWINSPLSHRLVLDYDDYLNRPHTILTSVVKFVAPHLDVDSVKIEATVADVRAAKDNRAFRFYDAAMAECLSP